MTKDVCLILFVKLLYSPLGCPHQGVYWRGQMQLRPSTHSVFDVVQLRHFLKSCTERDGVACICLFVCCVCIRACLSGIREHC